LPVYFGGLRSPWQRPSNENTNGLIHEYLPKGTPGHHWHLGVSERWGVSVSVTLKDRLDQATLARLGLPCQGLTMAMDPTVAQLLANLAEMTVRNSASAITTKVQAIRQGRKQEEALNELEEMINELVADRERLVGIAQGLEAALGAQRISPDDIDFIVKKVIPTVEKLIDGEQAAEAAKFIEPLKALLSVDTLTVLQLIGFNYKAAIGEPLTELVRHMIAGRVTAGMTEAEILEARRQVLLLEIIKDPDAHKRLRES